MYIGTWYVDGLAPAKGSVRMSSVLQTLAMGDFHEHQTNNITMLKEPTYRKKKRIKYIHKIGTIIRSSFLML